jgi:hypothetical protein
MCAEAQLAYAAFIARGASCLEAPNPVGHHVILGPSCATKWNTRHYVVVSPSGNSPRRKIARRDK